MAPDLARDTPIDRGPDTPPDARKDTATPLPDSKSATPDSKPDRGPFLELLAGGLGGPGNSDGTGAAARFSRPIGLAIDEAGNLFIADSGNHTIRKMVLVTGQVTTLAGVSGESGSKDGVGAAARFNYPNGLATDGAGNLFVADIQDQTVRKVVIATGQVTTLAGASEQMNTIDGIGREARFNAPASLVVDGSNLYVAEDIASGALRKINLKTSEVTTITLSAGKANQEPIEFSTPSGLVNDGAGHLYFVDSHQGTIYKMTLATGEVNVVVGSSVTSCNVGIGGGPSFCQPQDLALDEAGNLYVADCGYYTIRKVILATGEVTTLTGTGLVGAKDGSAKVASFSYRYHLAVDKAGDLLVSDMENNAIRKVATATGQVTTIAGAMEQKGSVDGTGSAARFGFVGSLASDGAGNLFLADSVNNTIRKVDIVTGEVTTFAGHAGQVGASNGSAKEALFDVPTDVTSDRAGNLFVADSRNNVIRKIVIATGQVTTLAGSGKEEEVDGPATTAGFQKPYSIASDLAGHLFVISLDRRTIRQVAIATGEVTTVSRPSETGFFPSDCGVLIDDAGRFISADYATHIVQRWDPATNSISVLAGTPEVAGYQNGPAKSALFSSPCALELDRSGYLFVADTDNHAVRKIALATGTVTTVVGSPDRLGAIPGPLPASLSFPSSLALGPAGQLFIADENAVLVAHF